MNKILHNSYHQLSKRDKSLLKNQFKSSPVMLRLITFLNSSSPNFKNFQAVEFIYEKSRSYRILENRYFKLRKKLLEFLDTTSQTATEDPIKNKIDSIKKLSLTNSQGAANEIKKFKKFLYSKCLFEYIPPLNELAINISHNAIDNLYPDSLFKEKNELTQLLAEIELMRKYTYEAYNHFLNNHTASSNAINALKKLALKHKKIIRFKLVYLIASTDIAITNYKQKNKKQIARQLQKMISLYKKNVDIPFLFADANYQQKNITRILDVEKNYYYSIAEYNKAFKINNQWLAYKAYHTPNIVADKLNANVLLLICMENYEDAKKHLEILSQYYRDHGLKDNLIFEDLLTFYIYFLSFSISKNQIILFKNKFESFLQKYPDSRVASTLKTCLLLIYILNRQYIDSIKLYYKEGLRQAIELYGAIDIDDQLMTIIDKVSKTGFIDSIEDFKHLYTQVNNRLLLVNDHYTKSGLTGIKRIIEYIFQQFSSNNLLKE